MGGTGNGKLGTGWFIKSDDLDHMLSMNSLGVLASGINLNETNCMLPFLYCDEIGFFLRENLICEWRSHHVWI